MIACTFAEQIRRKACKANKKKKLFKMPHRMEKRKNGNIKTGDNIFDTDDKKALAITLPCRK